MSVCIWGCAICVRGMLFVLSLCIRVLCLVVQCVMSVCERYVVAVY